MRLTQPSFSHSVSRTSKAAWRAVRCCLLTVAVAIPTLPALAQTTTLLDFDATPLGPAMAIDATAYLNSFGITLSAVTPGSQLFILGQGFPGLPVAHSAPNYFNQFHGNRPETMTMTFLSPLSSISFFRTAMTYDSKPEWTAEALNSQGMVLGTVGEPLSATGATIGAMQFTLSWPDIAALRINSDNHAFTNLSGVPIDDMTLVTSTPEPATIALVGSGLLLIGGVVRRHARRGA